MAKKKSAKKSKKSPMKVKQKSDVLQKTLLWTPRILVMLFAVFISLFALDVFGVGYTFWETILAFLIHLVPTYLVVIALLVAWKWPRVGGSIFVLLGLWYIWMAWGKFIIWTYVIIAGPPILVGILFWLSYYFCRR